MEVWAEYLKRRSPSTFIVEEVPAFQDIDQRKGVSYLYQFCNRCARQGYLVRVLCLNHNTWCDMPRERLWICGFKRSFGEKAADWVDDVLHASTKFRAELPVTSLLGQIRRLFPYCVRSEPAPFQTGRPPPTAPAIQPPVG